MNATKTTKPKIQQKYHAHQGMFRYQNKYVLYFFRQKTNQSQQILCLPE